jgi:hypothetical protein
MRWFGNGSIIIALCSAVGPQQLTKQFMFRDVLNCTMCQANTLLIPNSHKFLPHCTAIFDNKRYQISLRCQKNVQKFRNSPTSFRFSRRPWKFSKHTIPCLLVCKRIIPTGQLPRASNIVPTLGQRTSVASYG